MVCQKYYFSFNNKQLLVYLIEECVSKVGIKERILRILRRLRAEKPITFPWLNHLPT